MMPARETERMMKLQDVILKAMAKKLTWIQAAEIAGMSVRNMQRMRQRYQEGGYTGLFDHRRGQRSIHRVPMEKAEKVLALKPPPNPAVKSRSHDPASTIPYSGRRTSALPDIQRESAL